MLNQLFKDKSNISILKLSVGSIISQLIPFLLMPALTRLYSPKDFGALAIFISSTLILAEIVTGKYEMAILLPSENARAIKLTTSTIYLNLILSFLVFILILMFKPTFSKYFDRDHILNNWIYLIPFAVFLNALYETLKDYSLRMNSYSKISRSFITRSTIGNAIQLSFGFLKYTSFGLIIGNICSHMAANIHLITTLKKERKQCLSEKLKFNEFIYLLKKYKDFPLFSMPSAVLTAMSYQLMLIILPVMFSSSIAGLYLLAQRILNIPISLISNSMRQVSYKEYSIIKNDLAAMHNRTEKLLKKVLIIGGIPTIVLLFWGPAIFKFVFGNKWLTAGIFAQILSIWYFMLFVSGPLSNLLIILRKQDKALIFQIITFSIKALCLFYCYVKHFTILDTLLIFSTVSTILLFILVIYILKAIKFSLNRFVVYLLTIIAGLGSLYLIYLDYN